VTERAQEATTQCGRMGAEDPAVIRSGTPNILNDELNQFAHDLLWTWEPRIEGLFRALDPERWESTRQNPVLLLTQLGDAGVAKALERDEVRQALDQARAAYREYYDRRPPFMDARAPLVVAYFSLEFGLAECLPIYSGGLGVLAGDHLKATSDLGLQLIAVELKSDALWDRRLLRTFRSFDFEVALVNGDSYALRYRDYFLSNTRHDLFGSQESGVRIQNRFLAMRDGAFAFLF